MNDNYLRLTVCHTLAVLCWFSAPNASLLGRLIFKFSEWTSQTKRLQVEFELASGKTRNDPDVRGVGS